MPRQRQRNRVTMPAAKDNIVTDHCFQDEEVEERDVGTAYQTCDCRGFGHLGYDRRCELFAVAVSAN